MPITFTNVGGTKTTIFVLNSQFIFLVNEIKVATTQKSQKTNKKPLLFERMILQQTHLSTG